MCGCSRREGESGCVGAAGGKVKVCVCWYSRKEGESGCVGAAGRKVKVGVWVQQEGR